LGVAIVRLSEELEHVRAGWQAEGRELRARIAAMAAARHEAEARVHEVEAQVRLTSRHPRSIRPRYLPVCLRRHALAWTCSRRRSPVCSWNCARQRL
jgi:hypothetical protein